MAVSPLFRSNNSLNTTVLSLGRLQYSKTGQLRLGQCKRGGALQDVSFDRLEPQEAFYSDINPRLQLPNDTASVSPKQEVQLS